MAHFNIRKILLSIAHAVVLPLRRLPLMAVAMYVLGWLSAVATLPDARGQHLYEHLWGELFVDVYVLLWLIAIWHRVVRRCLAVIVSVLLTAIAIVDVFCFVKYGSTLTPTMLLLVGETNSREAGEFLQTCFSQSVVFSAVGWILLFAVVYLVLALVSLKTKKHLPRLSYTGEQLTETVLSIAVIVCFALGLNASWHNKQATYKLMSGRTIGEVEHTLTEKDHATLYLPVYRLTFSIYANHLASQQIDKLIAATGKAKIGKVSYRSPNIVLIIGESFNRHHSQQYGYFQPTTPSQLYREEHGGHLVKFTDVVSPWNLTSFVFKFLFSMHCVGEEGEWCDRPLFPELFRKAGYHVTFLTNQFLPQAREAVYDFSGGFFLNNPQLDSAMFDTRNKELHRYDEGLLDDYDALKGYNGKYNLTIFHLGGMHVRYSLRSPDNRKKFHRDDYKERKPHLNDRERQTLADYDNAILYNDSIVNQIIHRFTDQEAIVIYVPDHGEECYEGTMHFFCRMHSAKIDARLAHAEFDIPFWIWCSDSYIEKHPYIFSQIQEAKDRRYMTDALPHLLLYLAGIETPEYDERLNLISPLYNEKRPRILKLTTDYDKL